MRKSLYIIIIIISWFQTYSQTKKETVYLLFNPNSSEKCRIEDGSGNYLDIIKYRKVSKKNQIIFNICQESFVLDEKDEIDTCNVNYLNKIKFETLQSINNKKEKFKEDYFFKNSVFKKIYLVEKQKDRIIKYPVIWNTDLVQN